jgi:opacity protein-like surface antigen
MKNILKAAAIAALLGSAALGTAQAADTVVTFDPGIVAYGYSDGYWTTKKEWRTWDKPEYVEVYRKHPQARYYEYRHDRDADMGWRGEIVVK